jgi:hypothetical protein
VERAEFRAAVFERDNRLCVVCEEPAEDAHHIMERRLWDDGGYHLDNGASVCHDCHLQAERTWLTPTDLRIMAGITKVLLPPHLYDDLEYDKWGNIVTDEGRIPGELFWDESVQKILRQGPVKPEEFLQRFKYPRTYHLPWSPGATKDDRIMAEVPWDGFTPVVITEKMDGENTTMYRDYIHARSLENSYHVSRNWVKNLHGQIAHEIPEGWRFCGENLQAKHSISYCYLPSYFMLFSVWDEHNRCLSWAETCMWAQLLDLSMVPVLWQGRWEDAPLKYLTDYAVEGSEGYVIRIEDAFDYKDFRTSLGKYVRAGHVDETRHHWKHTQMIENTLSNG